MFFKYCLIFFFALQTLSCNPFYVIKSAYKGAEILIAREKIETLVKAPKTNRVLKNKLNLVLAAKKFGKKNALTNHGSFNYYTKVRGDAISYVVIAAKKDALKLKTWWFPIVGSVPYKGFFSENEAIDYAKTLDPQYETSIGKSKAYSTLGWFDDPITTPLIKTHSAYIANTIFHELTHQTVWIKNNVTFNESLATFVGDQMAVDFFRFHKHSKYLEVAKIIRNKDLILENIIKNVFNKLDRLYKSNLTKDQILKRRTILFREEMKVYKKQFPTSNNFKTINNAEIMQAKIYLTKLSSFQKLYKQSNENWKTFFDKIRTIKEICANTCDPFVLIDKI